MMKLFEGRTAMVTGAGKNIGKEIALGFAREGANVIICDYNEENALETAREIAALGVEAMPAVCDVRDREKIFEYVAEAVKRFGKIDFLVNNAGGSAALLKQLTRFVDAEPSTLDFVIDTNLKGAFNTVQHSARYFVKQRSGKIINISSVSGVMGNAGQANYAASKAGLIGLTKSVAKELGSRGICVNAVAPGFIRTEMTDALGEKTLEKMIPMIPLRRMGTAEDVADLVAFLAGEGSDYITGQVICIDGGLAM